MSQNIQLTPIQVDFKQHVDNRRELRRSALQRIIQIRKEINILHDEEAKLELISESLYTSEKVS